ncbi:hypothetical protein BpHYR1_000771 [Brachionus plicatilis]|uniref:Uncharacterized protein n=1 Tax=Brachionus plicatilis TaxID=10195 RepID=A0A3M7QNI6_BRAPC|nr:hypothetical protein BpHYR1_000771 [Brachionus plicatilis]
MPKEHSSNNVLGKSKPVLLKLRLLNTRDNNFYQIQTCFLNRPAPPRKKLDVGKDTELKIYKKMPELDSDDEDEDLVDSSDEEDLACFIF